MVLNFAKRCAALAVLSAVAWFVLPAACPAGGYHQYGPSDLFYNYYEPPGCCGVGAEMYPCPRPVPSYVGQTYYTYQPALPQENLYHHTRQYNTYQPCSGWTSTHIQWNGCDAGGKLSRLFCGPYVK